MNDMSILALMKNSDFIPTGYHSANHILVNSVSDYFTFLETVIDAV
jgi:hypothetical protein